MTVPVAKHRYTIEEYLRMERDALDKHEFHEGEILAMSGGTVRHSSIAANVGREIGMRLKGKPCRNFDSNLRVRIPGTERYVYPDASVICGTVELDASDANGESVTNPKLIVEVLSPSTEHYDRTTKFDVYRKIASLEEYVLVSQDQPRIEVFRRGADGSWTIDVVAGTESSARLKSINVDLPLAEAYAGVEFAPPADGTPAPVK